MARRAWWVGLALCGLWLGCGEDAPVRASLFEPVGGTGGSPAGGRAGGSAGGAAGSAGSSNAGDAGRAGGAPDGGSGGLSFAGAPGTGGAPDCATGTTFGDRTTLLSRPGTLRLLSMTPDARTFAYLDDEDLRVSDRASATDKLTAGKSVALPATVDPTLGAALSADGLRLVLVGVRDPGAAGAAGAAGASSEQTAFEGRLVELTRASRSDNFDGSPAEGSLLVVNDFARNFLDPLSFPVLSRDDRSLYYRRVSGTRSQLWVSRRATATGPFDGGVPVDSSAFFLRVDAEGPQPHALSADERWLFFFDPADNKTRAAVRSAATFPFTVLVELDDRRGAAVGEDCGTLYASELGDGANLISEQRR